MARAGCRFIPGNGDKEHKQKQQQQEQGPAFSGSNFLPNKKSFQMHSKTTKKIGLWKNYLFVCVIFLRFS